MIGVPRVTNAQPQNPPGNPFSADGLGLYWPEIHFGRFFGQNVTKIRAYSGFQPASVIRRLCFKSTGRIGASGLHRSSGGVDCYFPRRDWPRLDRGPVRLPGDGMELADNNGGFHRFPFDQRQSLPPGTDQRSGTPLGTEIYFRGVVHWFVLGLHRLGFSSAPSRAGPLAADHDSRRSHRRSDAFTFPGAARLHGVSSGNFAADCPALFSRIGSGSNRPGLHGFDLRRVFTAHDAQF